jgi:alkylated DNA repair protein (DNA oxidative demethylase)
VLINFYSPEARLGMHQDKDERADAPVVSLSLGNACLFRFGNTANRSWPYTDLVLRSGDLFVFGGPLRFAFHGPALGLVEGPLNLTMRVTGLPGYLPVDCVSNSGEAIRQLCDL